MCRYVREKFSCCCMCVLCGHWCLCSSFVYIYVVLLLVVGLLKSYEIYEILMFFFLFSFSSVEEHADFGAFGLCVYGCHGECIFASRRGSGKRWGTLDG